MAKKKPKKTKKKSNQFQYKSKFFSRPAISEAWKRRKANPSYSTPEAMQARREASRKAYATRAGKFYEPEVIPKYAPPTFISEQFERDSAIEEGKRLRKYAEKEYASLSKRTRQRTTFEEFSRDILQEYENYYWAERVEAEADYWRNADIEPPEMPNELKPWATQSEWKSMYNNMIREYGEAQPDMTLQDYINVSLESEINRLEYEKRYRAEEIILYSPVRSGSIKNLEDALKYAEKYAPDLSKEDVIDIFVNNSPLLTDEQKKNILDHFNKPSVSASAPYYGSDEDYGYEDYADDSDYIIDNFKNQVDQFEPSSGESDYLQNRRERYQNAIKDILDRAVRDDGKQAVASRLEDGADEINEIMDEMLRYTSGNQVLTEGDMRVELARIANIINGSAISNDEAKDLEDILEEYGY